MGGMATSGHGYEAYDAGVDTARSDSQQAYLDAIAEQTAAAVKKIRGQIKGLERSLKTAEAEAEQARKAARKGGDS
jgi:methyl-accepting chemotaxis protein